MQWAKAGAPTLIKTRSANLRVYWAGGALPPNVFVGSQVVAVGKIITYDQGKIWRVSDAIPIASEWKKFIGPLYRYLEKHAADPFEWIPPEVALMYRTGKRPS